MIVFFLHSHHTAMRRLSPKQNTRVIYCNNECDLYYILSPSLSLSGVCSPLLKGNTLVNTETENNNKHTLHYIRLH